jgi:hypothetical protein
MSAEREFALTISGLQRFAGRPVRVRLTDETEYVGRLRTELLTERSLAVFLAAEGDDGMTLYIEHIIDVRPTSAP